MAIEHILTPKHHKPFFCQGGGGAKTNEISPYREAIPFGVYFARLLLVSILLDVKIACGQRQTRFSSILL